MSIYPYVYVCTHKITNQIYIGARCANHVPSQQDLGTHYFTSSKLVKPIFHEFNCEIIFEGSKEEAFQLEAELIAEHWGQPYLINRANKGEKFNFIGKTHSEEYKQKMKKLKSEEHKQKISESLKCKTQKKLICPHCGKEGGNSLMKRWHFDNCKQK